MCADVNVHTAYLISQNGKWSKYINVLFSFKMFHIDKQNLYRPSAGIVTVAAKYDSL